MKVAFDHQIFSIQRFGGISKYFSELINYLIATGMAVGTHFPFYVNNHLPKICTRGKIFIPQFKGSTRLCKTLNQIWSEDRPCADVYHSTYYMAECVNLYHDTPMVVTVHDMIPELFPHQFNRNPHDAKRDYISRAKRIICVSNTTKKDLISQYGISDDNIAVVYHGVNLRRESGVELIGHLPDEFFLYIGRRDGHKNFNIVLRALEYLRERGHDVYLVCIGGGRLSPRESSELKRLALNKIVWIEATDRQTLFAMRRAIALVMPSLYEGFGIPIIEAMSQECPLVLADAGCFPEIARDTALYFDPTNSEALADAMLRIKLDHSARRELSTRASRLVKDYSLDRMGRQTLSVYESIL